MAPLLLSLSSALVSLVLSRLKSLVSRLSPRLLPACLCRAERVCGLCGKDQFGRLTNTWRGEKEKMMDEKIRIAPGTLRLGQKKVVTYSSAVQEM